MSFDSRPEITPSLFLFAAVPAARGQGGTLWLDPKFVAGMKLYARGWHGPVTAILREACLDDMPGATCHDPNKLDFAVRLLRADEPLEAGLERGPGVVLASVDVPDQLVLGQAARRLGLGLVYGVEGTLATRLNATLRSDANIMRRLWSAGWNLLQERRRCKALRDADGVQMNGFSVAHEYGALNRNGMQFLDNRMRREMFASAADLDIRRSYLQAGRPLRLLHIGRLERAYGAGDLIPLAEKLRDAGIPFHLTIEGSGRLYAAIGRRIAARKLGGCVTLRAPQPFGLDQAPDFKTQADVMISCRAQAEPSATFVEAMACGLPILGFDNSMLSTLVRKSDGGWTVPKHSIDCMVRLIGQLNQDRVQLIEKAACALDFAARHDFETEFMARTRHLRQVFTRTRPEPFVASALLGRRGRAIS